MQLLQVGRVGSWEVSQPPPRAATNPTLAMAAVAGKFVLGFPG